MAIIPQTRLFCWEQLEDLGDLDRLVLVLKAIADERLMQLLEANRGKGRDDYPVRAVWNSILAGVVYEHPSVESLRRELLRNAQLRQLCGFDPLKGASEAVPEPSNYTRFLSNVMAHQAEIDRMFAQLVQQLYECLGDFGRYLALDSKGIESHARARKNREGLRRDGRRELDADFGKKTYSGSREDGTLWKRVRSWFGYKLHLIVDADYELPVAYEVSRASRADCRVAPPMIEGLEAAHPELYDGCEALMGDRAYDDVKIIDQLWGDADDSGGRRILPIIPKREDWKDGEKTRPLCEGVDNITYDCQGQLYCVCWKSGKERAMVYWGYEKSRDSQKWRCPAASWGFECKSWGRCNGDSSYGRVVRVSRGLDRRTFLPVARESLKFRRLYRKRTAVERVNSRLDVSFGFERHFIRGLAKMRFRCSLALLVMLSMALGRARENRERAGREARGAPTVRSLVGAVV